MTGLRQKILVIRHGAFGDIVQSDGALRDLRAHHPDAEIVLLTTPPFVRLMERCPHVDRTIVDERAPAWKIGRTRALRRQLQQERFAKVYDLQSSDRTNLYRRLMLPGVPWSGRPKRSFPLVGRKVPRPPGLKGIADQLRAAGVEPRHTLEPDVSWMVEDVSGLLAEKGVRRPYVALIPGCSARHPYKRWPHYGGLAAGLREHGLDAVTLVGPDELELARTIPAHTMLKAGGGLLSWFELAGVLQQAAFVVGNDTGPSHVAACLNRPGLALFGPVTSAERTGLRRGRFDAIEVPDLANLEVKRVLSEVLRRVKG